MGGVARRVVSVVFADLVGFTALSERLDAEDVARIQDEFFARATAALQEHGGVVEKYIGDAVMATFGVALASDDDAVRAVRAATELRNAARRTEAPLGLVAGTLDLRVGVNTGEVVVSRVGDGWRVTGDVVNTAARLQAAASPGEVLLGPETAFGVAHAFALEPAGEVTLRGKAQPVSVWRPVGRHAVARRGLAALGLHAPTLGRGRILEDLLGRLAPADVPGPGAARRRAVLVVAPPGVGKSRLAEEVCLRAAAAGHPTLVARAGGATGGTAGGYGAVAQLVRGALAVTGAGSTAEAATAAGAACSAGHAGPAGSAASAPPAGPGGQDGVAAWPEGKGFGAEHARTAAGHVRALLDGRTLTAEPADLFTSWVSVLDAVPGPEPLWVVEDVHAAGPDLRAFLAHVLTDPGRGLVVLTARPDASLTDAGPLATVPVLHLAALDGHDTEALVHSLVGPGAVPERYVRGIVRVSGGNPLFVEELLRSWILGGVLRPREGGWVFDGELEPALPTTVHAIYQAQLDRLAPGSRAVVERGSVPGTTFPSAALPALGVDDASPALDALTRAGLLSGPHDGLVLDTSYSYRHALLRDTAYASLARGQRAQLHARFAEWVRERGPAELVGLHLALALDSLPGTAADLDGRQPGDVADEAARWLERAAAEQLVPAPQRAAELLGKALDVAPGAPGLVRLRRTLARAEALRRSGRLADAMVTFRDGGTLAREVGAPAGLAEAALGYENALFASRLPRETWGEDGLVLLRAALESGQVDGAEGTENLGAPLPGGGTPPHAGSPAGAAASTRTGAASGTRAEVRLLAALGRALVYSGRRGEGVAAAAEAVRLAEAAGDAAAVAECSLAQRAGLASPAHLGERLAGLDRAVAAAALTDDGELQLEAARLQLVDALEAGDVALAGEAQRRATELATHLGRPLYLWYPPMWEAMHALLAGSYAAAPGLIDAFSEQAHRSHYADAGMVRTIQLLELQLMTGGAPQAVAEVEALAEEAPDRWSFAVAVVHARAGDAVAARRALDRYTRADLKNVADDLSRSTTLAYLAEAATAVGTPQECRGVAQLLQPWSGHVVVLGSGALCLGAADHFLGVALRAAGETDAAVRHLRAAVEQNDALGAAGRAAWSRAELGRTMRGDGRPGATELLRRARADAVALGLAPLGRALEQG
ncbi:adenylate/guanylate cyclase domain-containing protein [Georgenia soli]|uniref:adenylate/guanylate cyclase domain-containing protein n=1 Tax=Georgenia soli TaxID=638953 RepID=UPI001472A859|nr:adenylate/guanylate cyclase domain-containing protein [Georgenia soli]